MQIPLQVTYRRLAHSDALSALVRRRAEKLEHLCARIISCHVVIELAGHHHRHGDHYRVSLNIGLPGRELIVDHSAPENVEETVHATADGAFDEATRQLEDWAKRGREHRHEEAHRAR